MKLICALFCAPSGRTAVLLGFPSARDTSVDPRPHAARIGPCNARGCCLSLNIYLISGPVRGTNFCFRGAQRQRKAGMVLVLMFACPCSPYVAAGAVISQLHTMLYYQFALVANRCLLAPTVHLASERMAQEHLAISPHLMHTAQLHQPSLRMWPTICSILRSSSSIFCSCCSCTSCT